MIVLMGYSITKVLLGILYVSIVLLILTIVYKKILVKLKKGQADPQDFCILYSLEKNPVQGEIEFYFTTKTTRNITLQLLQADMTIFKNLFEKEVKEGGQIVRFDSTTIANGDYFFQLVTENQKTMKKFTVLN
ncbi:MAG: hypothetical protein HYR91_08310 [Flavobacteriia bacterium]|nr:hypothetical protein [Flavobacteriia bacterium]